MPFDWQGYVALARDLERQAGAAPEPESLQRSAVSRAYFGAYCHARNYAKNFLEFAAREDADDHGRLRAHLKGKRRKGDADRLEQLRQLRNEADYLDELPWSDRAVTVAAALLAAEYIYRSLTPPKATEQ
ncbi:MAG: hypothetical protein U0793_30710 [Gemmataceae bacterium]